MDLERVYRPIERLAQSDNQSCLFCCLLMARSAYTQQTLDFATCEKDLHVESYGLYLTNFMLGKCAAFTRHFKDTNLDIAIDNSNLVEYLKGLNKESNIRIRQQKISAEWIFSMISSQPLILFVDYLQLGGDVHAPHFIYTYSDENGEFQFIDPAGGVENALSHELLENAILGLKYQMLWSPAIIAINPSGFGPISEI